MNEPWDAGRHASRVALYRGLIALAWADHELHEDERAALHDILDAHLGLTAENRAVLHTEVERSIQLEDVWPQITEARDRARLIDMANIIFQQDGEYSAEERAVIHRFTARHLASVNADSIASELALLTDAQKAVRDREREEMKAWASQYSIIGRLKAAFGKD
tara:strand:- start:1691 stop:2179 length:489 start_codon:yes stop_codon:yes gene_type:complete